MWFPLGNPQTQVPISFFFGQTTSSHSNLSQTRICKEKNTQFTIEEERHEVNGGEIPDVGEMDGDMEAPNPDLDMAAADDDVVKLDEMKNRLNEMEDEAAAALREMQAKVEKEMGAQGFYRIMARAGTSMLGSLVVFTVILSLQEIYRGKLASSELFTILGGFTSSLLFLFSLTFIGNFQESSGIKSGWGAVILAEIIALIAASTVHRFLVLCWAIVRDEQDLWIHAIQNRFQV